VAYKINNSETLETIAQDHYGGKAYWKTLWNDNSSIEDPNNLQVGVTIRLRIEKPEKPDELIAKLTGNNDVSKAVEPEVVQAKMKQIAVVPTVNTPLPTPIIAAVTSPAAVVVPPATYEDVYKQAGTRYGVPWQVLYGIHMTESGGRDGAISSGNGPQGPMQFMPGTFNSYAVDGDGDGKADINNAKDAIYTAANYMAKHGSVDAGLRSYGGNTNGTLNLARAKGYGN
jgi:membrane-bound lytic murein transglycosylase B